MNDDIKARRAKMKAEKAAHDAETSLRHAHEQQEDILAQAAEFLKINPMRAILRQGVYFMQRDDGTWFPVEPGKIAISHSVWSPKFAKAITVLLEEAGHTYNDTTFSCRSDLPKDVFNQMDVTRWVPIHDDPLPPYHWMFDVLVQSLGGNKQENMDHLEHVIMSKYAEPGNYKLPSILLHGQGGTGKNVLVDMVLGTMFNGRTVSLGQKLVLGEFNSSIGGMVVVLIDEGTNANTNETMRGLIGNPYVMLNPKGIIPFRADNTALYLISCNDDEGGLHLNRSNADRRYSVIHVPKSTGINEQSMSLNYWVAVRHGWIKQGARGTAMNDACNRASAWMDDEGAQLLTDKEQLSRWITALILRHAHKPRPMALHGEDFNRLIGLQQTIAPRIIEAVFRDPDFSHIGTDTLYAGYRERSQQYGYMVRKEGVFTAMVAAWLENNLPHIVQRRPLQSDQKQHRLWVNTQKEGASNPKPFYRVNDETYMNIDRKPVWVGPDL